MLYADALRCCHDEMRKVCGDFDAEPREFNGEEDQVYLLVEYPSKVLVASWSTGSKACRPGGYDRSSPAA
jgi:REP element-mobilizing transposase RayT